MPAANPAPPPAPHYIDAVRAAERRAPTLSSALEQCRGDRADAHAEAVLYIAEAVAALEESGGPLRPSVRDSIVSLRALARLVADEPEQRRPGAPHP